MMRWSIVGCALFLLAGSASSVCAQDEAARLPDPGTWRSYRGNRALQGVAQEKLADAFEVAWTYEIGKAITSSPVVSDGRVYIGADDYRLHCVDLATGKGLWSFETEDIVEASALVVDGLVVFGSMDYFVYALDAKTGELRWKVETDDKIVGSANWVRTKDRLLIVVGSYDARIYAFDAKTGDKVWEYATDNYVNGTPALWKDRVVFGGCDGFLHQVSVETGEALGHLELGEECYVASSVAVFGDRAYFGHYGNAFVCIDLVAQEPIWKVESRDAFFSSASVTKDVVVFGARDKRLRCVDRATGETKWAFATRRKIDGSPVICGSRVVFGSADGNLYVLDLDTGDDLWSYEVGRSLYSSPAVVNGKILIGSADGLLYAFAPKQ
ncbi:MAG: PQQ-binding-like beta-propeller repeat protein [Planctomycetes bacterium]|nr:PQQ-binding-like beta-propeller repeat protein [Planctomycetota bacterium]